ncbi:class I SAM-dependent methyltransferase [Streptomyces sp. NPDC006798]|uniref:class I SAM-dependent methyltransferase n=1 Tax=Streptomyces sp. NPDC006798 TaxID=3155462 RepID=UPI00340FE59C
MGQTGGGRADAGRDGGWSDARYAPGRAAPAPVGAGDAGAGFRLTDRAPEQYERYAAPIMTPFVGALLGTAPLSPGTALLDLACGTGFVARSAAARLAGTGSRVVGVDPAPGMLLVAAEHAVADGIVVEWQEASAGDLPYANGSFDSVLCQQGVQFFPDRDAGVAEAARVTRPGGLLGFTAWAPMGRSPFFAATGQAMEENGAGPIMDWYATAFECGADQLSGLLTGAGLTGVTVREVVAEVALPPLADYVPGFMSATPWGRAFTDARPDGVPRSFARIRELLAPWETGDGSAQVEFVSYLVTGVRPPESGAEPTAV